MGMQRRRAVSMLAEPTVALKLPLMLLAMTLVFAGFQTWHSYHAFHAIFDALYHEAARPEFMDVQLAGQTRAFIEVSGVVAIGYLLVVIALVVTFTHRLLGPTVAIRRHVEALKNGDYASRLRLRKGDSFATVQDDLNELAELLERDDAKRDS